MKAVSIGILLRQQGFSYASYSARKKSRIIATCPELCAKAWGICAQAHAFLFEKSRKSSTCPETRACTRTRPCAREPISRDKLRMFVTSWDDNIMYRYFL